MQPRSGGSNGVEVLNPPHEKAEGTIRFCSGKIGNTEITVRGKFFLRVL